MTFGMAAAANGCAATIAAESDIQPTPGWFWRTFPQHASFFGSGEHRDYLRERMGNVAAQRLSGP
jgi:hypothetical protein